MDESFLMQHLDQLLMLFGAFIAGWWFNNVDKLRAAAKRTSTVADDVLVERIDKVMEKFKPEPTPEPTKENKTES